jgi:hypothetical protein
MDFQQFQYYSSPIVKDFHTFLDYLKGNKLKLTNTLFHLPKKDLFRLNQLMTHPEKGVNERNKQNLYPQLHLFYHLLLSSELAWVERKSKSNVLLHLNLEKIDYFKTLKPTEQYFFLFKTLFQYCDFEKISTEERGGRIFFHQVDELFLLAIKLKEGKASLSTPRLLESKGKSPEQYPDWEDGW